MLLEPIANAIGLVALEFDLTARDCSSAAEALTGVAAEILDLGRREMRRQLADDDDRLAATLGFFATKDNAMTLRGGTLLAGARERRFRPCGQAGGFKCGKKETAAGPAGRRRGSSWTWRKAWENRSARSPKNQAVPDVAILADFLRRTLAHVGVEDLLAEPEGLRSHFDVFVRSDVLQRTLKAHNERGLEGNPLYRRPGFACS